MKFEGTPGPWRVSRYYSDSVTVLDSRGYAIVAADTMPILENYSELLGINHWADDERACLELSEAEQAANAHLIAAAPELLESLQTIQSKMSEFITLANEIGINADDGFYLHAAMEAEQKARAAIEKAIGKEE